MEKFVKWAEKKWNAYWTWFNIAMYAHMKIEFINFTNKTG